VDPYRLVTVVGSVKELQKKTTLNPQSTMQS